MAEDDGGEEKGIIARLALPSPHINPRLKNSKLAVRSEAEMDDLEKIFQHLFYTEMRVSPEEHGVLLTEHIFASKAQREQITTLAFENFSVTKVMFATQELLACVANGQQSGLIVHVGNTYASVVPIWNCNVLRDKARIIPVGGQDITRALYLMLQNRELGLYQSSDLQEVVVDDIKVKLAYVSADIFEELSKPIKMKKYELPDGQEVELGEELFLCTECLFDPSLVGIHDTPGLVDCIVEVIDSLELHLRDDIVQKHQKIILTGSSTMFPGLTERITKGIQNTFLDLSVTAPPERKSSSWIGGSIWTSVNSAKTWWTSREEYDEWGPSVVHSKCL